MFQRPFDQKLKRFRQILAMLVVFTLPLFVYWRVQLVDQLIGTAFSLDGAYDLAVINADGLMMALIAGMLLIAWFSNKLIATILRFSAVVLLLFYLVDLLVLKNLGIRILFSSAQLYGQDVVLVWEQLEQFVGGTWSLIAKLALLGVFFTAILLPVRKPGQLLILIYSCSIAISVTVALLPWKVEYVNNWIIQNYLSANIFVPQANTYSADMKAEILASVAEPQQCSTGLSGRKNVIFLLVESWSPYQSRLFSGLNDWTPELDAIAEQAVIYPNMHANGFSTSTGLIGLLGGVRLFSPFRHNFRLTVPFQTVWGLQDTLPKLFNSYGYHTAFLTTGPLNFANKVSWLQNIGFAETDDNKNPFYKDWDKIQFRAATDEALYQHSLDWIAARDRQQPWMLTLETVSTHQPYLDPATGKPDIEAVFRFADHQAGRFINALEENDFFENGILVVMGDHRSMTPMTKQEKHTFGEEAFSKIPFFILNGDQPQSHEGNFQLSDVLPSFQYWLADEVCYSGTAAVLFDLQSVGRCAFHVRGANPALVDVFCPEGQGQVKLNGDDTGFVKSSGISPGKQASLLTTIGLQRLQGQQRHEDDKQNHALRLKAASE